MPLGTQVDHMQATSGSWGDLGRFSFWRTSQCFNTPLHENHPHSNTPIGHLPMHGQRSKFQLPAPFTYANTLMESTGAVWEKKILHTRGRIFGPSQPPTNQPSMGPPLQISQKKWRKNPITFDWMDRSEQNLFLSVGFIIKLTFNTTPSPLPPSVSRFGQILAKNPPKKTWKCNSKNGHKIQLHAPFGAKSFPNVVLGDQNNFPKLPLLPLHTVSRIEKMSNFENCVFLCFSIVGPYGPIYWHLVTSHGSR